MATTLSLLNNVLTGLRKGNLPSNTTTITDTYHLLVLQFLNTAKRAVEAAWDWQALRRTVTVTTAQGVDEYELSISGGADADVGPRSRLLYERTTPDGPIETSVRYSSSRPQVFDVTDSQEYRVNESTWETLERVHFTDNDEQERPQIFALRRTNSAIKLRLWPTPAGARTLKLRFVIPQDDLPATDVNTTDLAIPADMAVWLRALVIANEERGEELSRPVTAIALEADTALSDSISFERTDADDTGYPE